MAYRLGQGELAAEIDALVAAASDNPNDDLIREMIAVDKPPGLAVHPAGRRVHGTLIHFLHTRYRRPEDPEHDVVPRLLHRIDRETSGVVMASLHEDFHSQVARQFEDRKVQKTYLAVVHGCPELRIDRGQIRRIRHRDLRRRSRGRLLV